LEIGLFLSSQAVEFGVISSLRRAVICSLVSPFYPWSSWPYLSFSNIRVPDASSTIAENLLGAHIEDLCDATLHDEEVGIVDIELTLGRGSARFVGSTCDIRRLDTFGVRSDTTRQPTYQQSNFLIMQGRITKVLNMRPQEILGMVEEASGTRMFEERKDKAKRPWVKRRNELSRLLPSSMRKLPQTRQLAS